MPRNRRHDDDDTNDDFHVPGSVADDRVTMTTKPTKFVGIQGDAAMVNLRAR
ncbi:hypothetical protein [Arthrobacter sp. AQ5-05]|uniref:hypothetical protein n=1 Tax=Arthrobacter sp. AQ5-05 TaxID=2184581 RepID=UPI0015EC50DC|nr:hypothetical protein [Arthrobacter sp. AQ5-05]